MQESGLSSAKKVAYFEYDFAKHGGAVGDITVEGDVVPADAVITGGGIHVKAAVTSGGAATMAIKALSAADILAATAKASLSLNALIETVPVPQTGSTWIRTTSALTALTFSPAVAALTAGKVVVALEYFVTA